MKKETKENRLKDENNLKEIKEHIQDLKNHIEAQNVAINIKDNLILTYGKNINELKEENAYLTTEIEELKKVAKLKDNNPLQHILLRILIFPLLSVITLIMGIYFIFSTSIKFIRYGGEVIFYEKGTIKNINDIYQLLKNNQHGHN